MPANSTDRYNPIARFLHWTMAILILGIITVGIVMTDLARDDPLRGQLFAIHKAVGVTVLGLAIFRILWTLVSKHPEMPAMLQRWEIVLAKSTVGLLYLLMLATPIAGYLMSNAAGKPISYFGLFDMPAAIGQQRDLAEILGEVHEILAYTILALVVLHAAGAIKHRYFDANPDADVLKRML